MISFALAYVRGLMVKFKPLKWNDYLICLLHDKDNIRRTIGLIPYFWDDDIHFTLALRPIRNVEHHDDIWSIKWRLLDLDGNRLKEGKDTVNITNAKWMRRYFGGPWTSGKRRAIVLGNLSPNRNYILKVVLTNGIGNSVEEAMATFSTKDRGDFYSQIFLILFSIVAALIFSALAKWCGL
ncbi:MAG: hypothetical protein Q8O43_04180 [Dehalococcoidia bacterium]|nr:hypothetical protein [Dehalococcoidia bacterium]